jgi:hypothetical protein
MPPGVPGVPMPPGVPGVPMPPGVPGVPFPVFGMMPQGKGMFIFYKLIVLLL